MLPHLKLMVVLTELLQPVTPLLEKAGYTTELVERPSVGPSKHLLDFSADVVAIRSRIQKAVDDGDKLVVVGHSYGGIPASEAVKGLDSASCQQAQKPGGVAHPFFLASFLIPPAGSKTRWCSSPFLSGILSHPRWPVAY